MIRPLLRLEDTGKVRRRRRCSDRAGPAADDTEEIIALSDQHAWLELRRARPLAGGMDLGAGTVTSELRGGGWTGAPLPMESTEAAS